MARCFGRVASVRHCVIAVILTLTLIPSLLTLLHKMDCLDYRRSVDVHPKSDSGKPPANALRSGSSNSTPPPNSITRSSSAPHPVEKPPAKDVRPPAPPGSQAGTRKEAPEVEKLPLFRDLYAQEAWPEISRDGNVTPDQVSDTVHYIWCGKDQQFRFQHYLGILSVIRLLQPLTIVFHYSDLPVPDGDLYHVWFWELKQSFASLELRPLAANHRSCDARQLTATALDLISQDGGLYIAPNVILTRFPGDVTRQPFWYSMAGGSLGILFSLRGFNAEKRQEHVKRIQAKERDCGSVENYNKQGAGSSPPCLLLTNQAYPKDIVTTKTPFAELARWLYYGKHKVMDAKQSPVSSIPRIGHVTWLRNPRGPQLTFRFCHFLTVVSALHVAGLRHVYVHGDVTPEGEWWDRLKGENVTFVPIHTINHVFQQGVNTGHHRSDVLRPHILHAYGGVYMDMDVMWVNRLPDSLLRYPTVACPDWPSYGTWPAAFNLGVLMAQSDSPWLRHFLASLRHFKDGSWGYNAILMPYKVYEMYPESLFIDYHLQVICFHGNCHPTWHNDYIRDIRDPRPPRDFDWRDGRAYHFTEPKPHESLSTPENIRKRQDMYAEMGRKILTRSGWGSLIGET